MTASQQRNHQLLDQGVTANETLSKFAPNSVERSLEQQEF
jgi:hypothetical protein